MKILYLNIYTPIKLSSHFIPTFAGKPFPHLGNYRVGKCRMLRIGCSVGAVTEISEVLPCIQTFDDATKKRAQKCEMCLECELS